MEKLISQQYDYVVKETLGKSVFDKGIDLITISAPSNLANKKEAVTLSVQGEEEEEEERKRIKVVFIMARVHPGETPSSFVVQGLIDFLVSSHDIAARQTDEIKVSLKLTTKFSIFSTLTTEKLLFLPAAVCENMLCSKSFQCSTLTGSFWEIRGRTAICLLGTRHKYFVTISPEKC